MAAWAPPRPLLLRHLGAAGRLQRTGGGFLVSPKSWRSLRRAQKRDRGRPPRPNRFFTSGERRRRRLAAFKEDAKEITRPSSPPPRSAGRPGLHSVRLRSNGARARYRPRPPGQPRLRLPAMAGPAGRAPGLTFVVGMRAGAGPAAGLLRESLVRSLFLLAGGPTGALFNVVAFSGQARRGAAGGSPLRAGCRSGEAGASYGTPKSRNAQQRVSHPARVSEDLHV